MADVIEALTDAGLCSEVHYKELYLPAAEINGKALAMSLHMHKQYETFMCSSCDRASFPSCAADASVMGFGASTLHFFPMRAAEVRGPAEGAVGLPDADVQAACELWHKDRVDMLRHVRLHEPPCT